MNLSEFLADERRGGVRHLESLQLYLEYSAAVHGLSVRRGDVASSTVYSLRSGQDRSFTFSDLSPYARVSRP